MQSKRKCLCVAWIINWALPIHCNPRVPYGANKLVSKVWVETDHRVLQKIYIILYSFCIQGKSFTRSLEVKQLPSPRFWSSKDRNYLFLISNDENDWVWKNFFEIFITILNVSVDIIGVLFFSTSINLQEALSLKVSFLMN